MLPGAARKAAARSGRALPLRCQPSPAALQPSLVA
jgi:hypothetical protein